MDGCGGFKKTFIKEKEKRGGIHQPFYGAWVSDFMLRQDAGRFMLGKCLSYKQNPMKPKETIGNGSGRKYANSQFTNIDKIQSAGCRLCRIAREARCESTDGLSAPTHGHINSEGCEGIIQATKVTTAHHRIWRHLYDSMHAAQKPKRKLKLVTLDKESNMSTMW